MAAGKGAKEEAVPGGKMSPAASGGGVERYGGAAGSALLAGAGSALALRSR